VLDPESWIRHCPGAVNEEILFGTSAWHSDVYGRHGDGRPFVTPLRREGKPLGDN